jgi:peroxiredoxin
MVSKFVSKSNLVPLLLGLELTHPGPMGVLGNPRCKRFAMYVVDGVVKHLEISASVRLYTLNSVDP